MNEMARLIKYLIISIIVVGCSSETHQANSENFQTWLSKNRIQPNERLIDFDYDSTNDPDIQYEIIEKTISGDTLIVSFYSTQPVGCLLIGDIEILENRVKVKFGPACDPNADGIVTEEADLIFYYKIKNGVDLEDVPFIIEGLTDLIK